MVQPPDRDCFGKGASLHIGKCFDVWKGYAFCMCRPVDAASYPNTDKLYCGTTIPRGTVRPNIKTYYDGVLTKTHSPKSGSEYMYVWWTSGGWTGTVRFDFCDGDVMLASRTTLWESKSDITCVVSNVRYRVIESQPFDAIMATLIFNKKPPVGHKVNVHVVGSAHTGYHSYDAAFFDEYGLSWEEQLGFTKDIVGREVSLLINESTGRYHGYGYPGNDPVFPIVNIPLVLPPAPPTDGEKRIETCWDLSTITTAIYDASIPGWVPTGEVCQVMPAHGETHTAPCWDDSVITTEIFDAALTPLQWVPTGEVCPTMPPHGEKRIPTTCWDGSEIHSEVFDALDKKAWVPTGETCPVKICEEGEKRSPHTCWDKSTIHTEVCRSNAWVPSGESCPTMLPRRVMEMAIPTIGYVGQAIEIVVQAYCGVALSSGEPAILVIDGEEIRTKNTLAGVVSFKWTAAGVGMHSVCVNIPVNPNCPVPGRVCKTITVSAYVAELAEQIKAEKAAYTTELERLRKLKEIEREMLAKVGVPGKVSIPPSLAGSIVEIGGIPTTVPPGGITIPVSPGESFVTIIMEGVRETIPVLVRPGAVVSLPALPGGL